jgi:hypothetical protein
VSARKPEQLEFRDPLPPSIAPSTSLLIYHFFGLICGTDARSLIPVWIFRPRRVTSEQLQVSSQSTDHQCIRGMWLMQSSMDCGRFSIFPAGTGDPLEFRCAGGLILHTSDSEPSSDCIHRRLGLSCHCSILLTAQRFAS